MQYTFTVCAGFAVIAAAIAAPAGLADLKTTTNDVVCGGLVSPLTGFLDYQSGNVATSTQGILEGVNGLIAESNVDSNIQKIVSTATDGLTESLVNGVSNMLYGLSAGIRGASPECKNNLQFCNSELQAAKDATAAGQPQAKDACLQAKYSCGQFYSSEQVDKMVPGCTQYTTSG